MIERQIQDEIEQLRQRIAQVERSGMLAPQPMFLRTTNILIPSTVGYSQIGFSGWLASNLGQATITSAGRLRIPHPACLLATVVVDVAASQSHLNTINVAISRVTPGTFDVPLFCVSRPYQHRMLLGGAATIWHTGGAGEYILSGFCDGVSGVTAGYIGLHVMVLSQG